MSEHDMHLLFQQMGEVLSGIRALHEKGEIRQTQVEQLHNLLRCDLNVLKREQHDLDEKFSCFTYVIQHDVESLRSNHVENSRAFLEVVRAMEALKRPMVEIMALKSRVAGLLLGVGFIGSAAIWLAEPVYRWIIDLMLSKS